MYFIRSKMGSWSFPQYSRFPETWKPVTEKLRPYFEERKKIKINPKKNWQDQDEQRLRDIFDAAYKNIMQSKQEWQEEYYGKRK